MNKIERSKLAAREAVRYDIPVYLYHKISGEIVVSPNEINDYSLVTEERVPVWRGELYVRKWITSKIVRRLVVEE